MAMKLRASGEGSLVVLEREAALGGVWRANTYPGCAYDAPSHLYWYAFDQVPDWSRVYARQPEILRTLQETAARHDVVRFIRYNSMVYRTDLGRQQRHLAHTRTECACDHSTGGRHRDRAAEPAELCRHSRPRDLQRLLNTFRIRRRRDLRRLRRRRRRHSRGHGGEW